MFRWFKKKNKVEARRIDDLLFTCEDDALDYLTDETIRRGIPVDYEIIQYKDNTVQLIEMQNG